MRMTLLTAASAVLLMGAAASPKDVKPEDFERVIRETCFATIFDGKARPEGEKVQTAAPGIIVTYEAPPNDKCGVIGIIKTADAQPVLDRLIQERPEVFKVSVGQFPKGQLTVQKLYCSSIGETQYQLETTYTKPGPIYLTGIMVWKTPTRDPRCEGG